MMPHIYHQKCDWHLLHGLLLLHWSDSLDYVALCWTVLVISVSVRWPYIILFTPAQWVLGPLLFHSMWTQQILQINMVYLCSPSLIYTEIYLHCRCDDLASTPPNRNCASQKLAIRWPPVALNRTQITPSCYGLDQKKTIFFWQGHSLTVLLLGLGLITSRNHVWLLGAMISC